MSPQKLLEKYKEVCVKDFSVDTLNLVGTSNNWPNPNVNTRVLTSTVPGMVLITENLVQRKCRKMFVEVLCRLSFRPKLITVIIDSLVFAFFHRPGYTRF